MGRPSAARRLLGALRRTNESVSSRLRDLFEGSAELDDFLDETEELLLEADLGVATTAEAVERLRERIEAGRRNEAELRATLARVLREALPGDSDPATEEAPPRVVFVVGVNGTGKTTCLAKLAHRHAGEGRKVLMAAADTFRAAAIEQLEHWAGVAGAAIVAQRTGSDPAAVVFDALAAARARGMDVVLVDTAGRLHTRSNLMEELRKMVRVAGREVAGAPHEVLLVLDATTGQNGLRQAELFREAAGVTGLVVTKMDGTARGGIALAASRELGVPIRWIGTGEGIEDLVPFDGDAYVEGLLT